MRVRAGIIILVLLGGVGCASRSAKPLVVPTDWSAVQLLPPDTRVRVVVRWGDSLVGSIVSVGQEQIRITGRATAREFKRKDVTKVFHQGARQTAKYRKVGSLIGLSAGAFLMASERRVSTFGLLMTGYWTGLGAAGGAWGGYTKREETLVYVAPVSGPLNRSQPF
jgi:hypothetical protein